MQQQRTTLFFLVAFLVFTFSVGARCVQAAESRIASYYHPSLRGNLMANGSRFNPDDLTTAATLQRDLSLGTRVRVTSLVNGRSLDMVIKDRGGLFYRNRRSRIYHRYIDVTPAAATYLGFKRRGTAEVTVTVL